MSSLRDFLRVEWRVRSYEVALLLFALVSLTLVQGFSELPFSVALAFGFLKQVPGVLLFVCMLALTIVGYRVLSKVLSRQAALLLCAVVFLWTISPFALSGFMGAVPGQRLLTLVAWRTIEFLVVQYLIIGLVLMRVRGKSNALTWSDFLNLGVPYLSLDFLMRTIRRSVATFAVFYFFLHLKHVVYFVNPANYDQLLWDLDRWLHFGVQPNLYLMDLLHDQYDFSLAIDWLYIKYFEFMLAIAVLFMLEVQGRIRSDRFFLAFILLWSFGGMLYVLLPADGPCFSLLIDHVREPGQILTQFNYPLQLPVPEWYGPYYEESKIWFAKLYQEKLWSARWQLLAGTGEPGMFYGIAAMPSLHVAAVMMLAFFLQGLSRIAGLFGWAYLVVMVVGAIFLQWHYAVDVYMGMLLSVFSFWVSGKLQGKNSDCCVGPIAQKT